MKTNQPVSAREETVIIPTYVPPPPDMNPMFFERRVNQGASGRVYPNPFTDHIFHEKKEDVPYQAIFLENEYIQLMILPQIGGRVHAALDKTNNYDFIFRQTAIRPMLVGLFGSWICGGMEFNWPLHHRPSTFMPVEYHIEHGEDGSATAWLSEHEPLNRMKGMVGICVQPGKACFEFKVRLYNRTPFPRPFLWWVNCGIHSNDDLQIVFPPDVESVTFHSRAFMATYPVARQVFAGVDWRKGVDISWYKNVTGCVSYFASPSKYDFFGGYDHGRQAGIIHVADHHISPGKKLFTWGQEEFGKAWIEALCAEDGDYAELMGSAYSDNQPDFSWLQPYETKAFSQYWYPVQQIGAAKNANSRVAISLDEKRVGVCATETFEGAKVILTDSKKVILEKTTDIIPGKPFLADLNLQSKITNQQSTLLRVLDHDGNELIRYRPELPKNAPLPPVAVPPKLPRKIDSLEELYLTGLHVEQYLHFALDPAPYWERALELDPGDSRNNNALGRLLIKRGDFARAESLLRRAIQTLTRYNFNPYDGEPYYNLGMALAYQGRYEEAYDAFYKGIWSYAWQAAGYYAIAQIDCRRGDFTRAIEHLDRSLATNANHSKARNLKAAALRHLGRTEEAAEIVRLVLEADPLDHWAHNELALGLAALDTPAKAETAKLERILRDDPQNYLDLAFDYANAGLYEEAGEVLQRAIARGKTKPSTTFKTAQLSTYPIIYYALGYFAAQMGKTAEGVALSLSKGADWYRKAAAQPTELCFPIRLEELIVLEATRKANPKDGRSLYYLGNLLYDKKQYERAIEAWEAATQLEPGLAIPWRNLGIAYYNKRGDKQAAKACYEKAYAANPLDGRLLLETNHLWQRLGISPAERLALMEKYPDLVKERDDLLVSIIALYNHTGQPEKALELLLNHQFSPWEGGEGRISGQYVAAHVSLGQFALEKGRTQEALEHFETAMQVPKNLGEGGAFMGGLDPLAYYYAARTYEALGRMEEARKNYQRIIEAEEKLALWLPFSPLSYYAAVSMEQLGDKTGGTKKLEDLLNFASQALAAEDAVGFFTSRPTMEVFDDDPKVESRIYGNYLIGLAHKGLGKKAEARKAFEAVLTLDPHHREAGEELKELR